jgi:hypothetical protein
MMKYASCTILLCLLASLLVVGCTDADSRTTELKAPAEGQWEAVTPQPQVGEKMRMAAFLDRNFGLTGGAGDVGKAHVTLDGGQTWTVAESSGG